MKRCVWPRQGGRGPLCPRKCLVPYRRTMSMGLSIRNLANVELRFSFLEPHLGLRNPEGRKLQ
ncbi:hypothetical protein T4E_5315 [Trichinella pseudospiralis]|uniref:Uncharacterized protein n=1 Tax=Trichinella pseudospiralis TaxID=6337 RepID=A0A0V0YAW5_TRIPS|nr:hypothetical protein T4E_5315 [Trichinella pseudospiralis]